jgi:DNA-binding response OmpR family regulator
LAISSGADDYLTKPFDIATLVAKVAELTDRP